MDAKRLFIGLTPWVLFSVIVQRHGANAAAIAAAAAAGLALLLALREAGDGGKLKLIPATGIVLFSAMSALGIVGGTGVDDVLANYGRGFAAVVLGVIMLASVPAGGFTIQYAREQVDQRYWRTSTFLAINRRISAAWGYALLVMGAGHLLAGNLDPIAGTVHAGARPVDLVLNWAVPVLVILATIAYSKRITNTATHTAAASLHS